MAKILTYPERVNQYNLDKLKQLVLSGPEKHPGANYVESFGDDIDGGSSKVLL
jgi:DNA-directed RNA polymerase III subunit RPC1